MKDELFKELVKSVREGGAILRGEKKAARTYVSDDPDVAKIREAFGLSQDRFATLLGISVRTLQNWEQGRRRPQGPAKILLKVAAKHPRAVLDVVKRAS
jgi:putative transcriptional regulator